MIKSIRLRGHFVSLPNGGAEWVAPQHRRGPPRKDTPDPTGRRDYMRAYMAKRRARQRERPDE